MSHHRDNAQCTKTAGGSKNSQHLTKFQVPVRRNSWAVQVQPEDIFRAPTRTIFLGFWRFFRARATLGRRASQQSLSAPSDLALPDRLNRVLAILLGRQAPHPTRSHTGWRWTGLRAWTGGVARVKWLLGQVEASRVEPPVPVPPCRALPARLAPLQWLSQCHRITSICRNRYRRELNI